MRAAASATASVAFGAALMATLIVISGVTSGATSGFAAVFGNDDRLRRLPSDVLVQRAESGVDVLDEPGARRHAHHLTRPRLDVRKNTGIWRKPKRIERDDLEI